MPVTVSPSQSDILKATGDFINSVLTVGPTNIVLGQENRVPEPLADDFVVMTPIGMPRLGTNLDEYLDCVFTGQINGTTLTVTAIDPNYPGSIMPGNAMIFGSGIAANTTILRQLTGTTGGIGTYLVSVSQSVTSQSMAAGIETLMQPTEVRIQVDIHGPNSWNNAEIITTIFRDERGVLAFIGDNPPVSAQITPLFADDPRQMPFTNENQQVENRWIVVLHLEVNQKLSLPQQFAQQVEVSSIRDADSYTP